MYYIVRIRLFKQFGVQVIIEVVVQYPVFIHIPIVRVLIVALPKLRPYVLQFMV